MAEKEALVNSPIDEWVEKFKEKGKVRIRLRTEGRWQGDEDSWLIHQDPGGYAYQWLVTHYTRGRIDGVTLIQPAGPSATKDVGEQIVRQIAALILTGYSPHYLACGTHVGGGQAPMSSYHQMSNIAYVFYNI